MSDSVSGSNLANSRTELLRTPVQLTCTYSLLVVAKFKQDAHNSVLYFLTLFILNAVMEVSAAQMGQKHHRIRINTVEKL